MLNELSLKENLDCRATSALMISFDEIFMHATVKSSVWSLLVS